MKKVLIIIGIIIVGVLIVYFYIPEDSIVDVKYQDDDVDISSYEYLDTSKSSFVNGAWYEEGDDILILKLSDEYYQYCEVPEEIWSDFSNADSFGSFYNSSIKGNFSCEGTNETPVENINDEQNSLSDSLEQERLLIYRSECQSERDEKMAVVDDLVQNTPNITPEQAKNLAINAGIADIDGYIIDEDIWVKDCLDRKIEIYE